MPVAYILLGNSASSLFVVSFLVAVFFINIVIFLTSFCKFFEFFVNKIGRHIDVNCQYATWTTDLIFDSDLLP